jgi:hypothetical protein
VNSVIKSVVVIYLISLPSDYTLNPRSWSATADDTTAIKSGGDLLTDDDCSNFCNSVNAQITATGTTTLNQVQAECQAVAANKAASTGDMVMAIADTTAAVACVAACVSGGVMDEVCNVAGIADMATNITVEVVQGQSLLGAVIGSVLGGVLGQ